MADGAFGVAQCDHHHYPESTPESPEVNQVPRRCVASRKGIRVVPKYSGYCRMLWTDKESGVSF